MNTVTSFQVTSLERSDIKPIASDKAQGITRLLISADTSSHSLGARPLASSAMPPRSWMARMTGYPWQVEDEDEERKKQKESFCVYRCRCEEE